MCPSELQEWPQASPRASLIAGTPPPPPRDPPGQVKTEEHHGIAAKTPDCWSYLPISLYTTSPGSPPAQRAPLTLSLPEREDTEEADEPDDRSCGPGRGRVRRGPKGGSGSRGSDAGRDWGQEEKGTTEDEMAGWHH